MLMYSRLGMSNVFKIKVGVFENFNSLFKIFPLVLLYKSKVFHFQCRSFLQYCFDQEELYTNKVCNFWRQYAQTEPVMRNTAKQIWVTSSIAAAYKQNIFKAGTYFHPFLPIALAALHLADLG